MVFNFVIFTKNVPPYAVFGNENLTLSEWFSACICAANRLDGSISQHHTLERELHVLVTAGFRREYQIYLHRLNSRGRYKSVSSVVDHGGFIFSIL